MALLDPELDKVAMKLEKMLLFLTLIMIPNCQNKFFVLCKYVLELNLLKIVKFTYTK